MDAAGLDGKAILTLTDYSLVVNPYSEGQKELPQYLMHDETADKWYKLDYEAYMAAGKWCMGGEEIFNNVV